VIVLRDHVWWPSLIKDVGVWCESLPVPSRPWESIGIDFVGPLVESRNRNGGWDMICVIIDHLTGMVHLAPTKQTYRAKDMAEVIIYEYLLALSSRADGVYPQALICLSSSDGRSYGEGKSHHDPDAAAMCRIGPERLGGEAADFLLKLRSAASHDDLGLEDRVSWGAGFCCENEDGDNGRT